MCVNGTKDPVRLLQAARAELLQVHLVQGFNPELRTQFGNGGYWKALLDGANNTGWKPVLHCFPECRAISRGHPGAISANPRQPRDGVE